VISNKIHIGNTEKGIPWLAWENQGISRHEDVSGRQRNWGLHRQRKKHGQSPRKVRGSIHLRN